MLVFLSRVLCLNQFTQLYPCLTDCSLISHYQELLLERADLFYGICPSGGGGALTQDQMKDITELLQEDIRSDYTLLRRRSRLGCCEYRTIRIGLLQRLNIQLRVRLRFRGTE